MLSRRHHQSGDDQREHRDRADHAQYGDDDVEKIRLLCFAIGLLRNLDCRRELRDLTSLYSHADPPECSGRERRALLKVKEPVAPVRLLKRERFLEIERADVGAEPRECVGRDRQRVRFLEPRADFLFVLQTVIADHFSGLCIHLGEGLVLLHRREAANHPGAGLDFRRQHVDDAFHRHAVMEQVVECDRVEAAGRAAVFAPRLRFPRAEPGCRCRHGLRPGFVRRSGGNRLIARGAVIDGVVGRDGAQCDECADDCHDADCCDPPVLWNRLGRRIRDRLFLARRGLRRRLHRDRCV